MVQIEILERFDVCVGRYIARGHGGCQKWRDEWIKRLHARYRANGVCATNKQCVSRGRTHTHAEFSLSLSCIHSRSPRTRCSRCAERVPLRRRHFLAQEGSLACCCVQPDDSTGPLLPFLEALLVSFVGNTNIRFVIVGNFVHIIHNSNYLF